MTTVRDEIIIESMRIEENCLYSAKGHFEAARVLWSLHYGIGIPIVVIAAITSLVGTGQWNGLAIASILAITVTALTAITTFVNPNKSAGNHQQAGTSYNNLLGEIRIFYKIYGISNNTDDELKSRLELLFARKNELDQASPPIPRLAYWLGKKGIKNGEAVHKVDVG